MRRLSSDERGMSLPGGMLAAAGVVTILAGSFVASQGMIRVSVDEKRPGGEHIHIMVPGAIVPAALAFVPSREIGRHMPVEARQHLPVAEAALEALYKLPDCTLVEVDTPDERVRIRIRDGRVAVDVTTEDEEVHVTLPMSTARSVLRKMARAAEYASAGGGADHDCDFDGWGSHHEFHEHGDGTQDQPHPEADGRQADSSEML